MKLRIVFLSLSVYLFVFVAFAQERIFPVDAGVLNLLAGGWLVENRGTWVEFHYDYKGSRMIGSTRLNMPGSRWTRMMEIYPEGQPVKVRADFFERSGVVTHYHLVPGRPGRIHFANDPVASAPLLELTYEKVPHGQVTYRFERDHRVVESGVMNPAVSLELLNRPEKLIQPLSD